MDIVTILICGIVIATVVLFSEISKMRLEKHNRKLIEENEDSLKSIKDASDNISNLINTHGILIEILEDNFQQDDIDIMFREKIKKYGLKVDDLA